MSLRFLLDTSTLSEPLRPAPHAGLMRRVRVHAGRLARERFLPGELYRVREVEESGACARDRWVP